MHQVELTIVACVWKRLRRCIKGMGKKWSSARNETKHKTLYTRGQQCDLLSCDLIDFAVIERARFVLNFIRLTFVERMFVIYCVTSTVSIRFVHTNAHNNEWTNTRCVMENVNQIHLPIVAKITTKYHQQCGLAFIFASSRFIWKWTNGKETN